MTSIAPGGQFSEQAPQPRHFPRPPAAGPRGSGARPAADGPGAAPSEWAAGRWKLGGRASSTGTPSTSTLGPRTGARSRARRASAMLGRPRAGRTHQQGLDEVEVGRVAVGRGEQSPTWRGSPFAGPFPSIPTTASMIASDGGAGQVEVEQERRESARSIPVLRWYCGLRDARGCTRTVLHRARDRVNWWVLNFESETIRRPRRRPRRPRGTVCKRLPDGEGISTICSSKKTGLDPALLEDGREAGRGGGGAA